jgi:hypothetical protein
MVTRGVSQTNRHSIIVVLPELAGADCPSVDDKCLSLGTLTTPQKLVIDSLDLSLKELGIVRRSGAAATRVPVSIWLISTGRYIATSLSESSTSHLYNHVRK